MLKASSVNEAPKTEDQNKEALESNVKVGVVDPTNPIKRTGRRLKNVDSESASELVVCSDARVEKSPEERPRVLSKMKLKKLGM